MVPKSSEAQCKHASQRSLPFMLHWQHSQMTPVGLAGIAVCSRIRGVQEAGGAGVRLGEATQQPCRQTLLLGAAAICVSRGMHQSALHVDCGFSNMCVTLDSEFYDTA